MTDVPGHEPAPTDAELDEVRSLLGEARVADPMPTDVAARLDDVLAGLAAERAEADVPAADGAAPDGTAADGTAADGTAADGTAAAVVPLHRRWAPRVLVAAAAVVVLGGTAYGVGRIAHSTSASSNSSTASSVQSTESSGGSPATPPASGARQPDFAQGSLAPLRTAHFAADARRALAGDLHALAAADATSGQLDSAKAAPSPSATPSVSAETPACPGPTQAGTVGAVVRLDGQAAALVVHPPQGGSRLVQAWSCDGSTLLASARVPVG